MLVLTLAMGENGDWAFVGKFPPPELSFVCEVLEDAQIGVRVSDDSGRSLDSRAPRVGTERDALYDVEVASSSLAAAKSLIAHSMAEAAVAARRESAAEHADTQPEGEELRRSSAKALRTIGVVLASVILLFVLLAWLNSR